MRGYPAVLLCCGLAACTVIDPAKERVDAVYFGVVRVTSEPVVHNAAAASDAPVIATDNRAFGFKIGDGVGAGWFRDQNYRIPTDCRVVVFVQDEAQLEAVSRQFKDFKEGVCTTVKSP